MLWPGGIRIDTLVPLAAFSRVPLVYKANPAIILFAFTVWTPSSLCDEPHGFRWRPPDTAWLAADQVTSPEEVQGRPKRQITLSNKARELMSENQAAQLQKILQACCPFFLALIYRKALMQLILKVILIHSLRKQPVCDCEICMDALC